MTLQEVKDEHKESEGSPELKGHLRARQREILKGGARKAVQEAHVVITNPTHFAVALRYDRGKDAAPMVAAKGRGATAQAIKELAMVSRQDHDLRVIATQDRFFKSLQGKVALVTIEFGEILDENSQSAIGQAELLDVPLASPILRFPSDSGP